MNIQQFTRLISIFIISVAVCMINKGKDKKYKNIVLIIILISTNISIPFQVKQSLLGNIVDIYIRISVFALILLCILTVNKRSFKIRVDEIICIAIIVQCLYQYNYNSIYNVSNFYQLLTLYISVLCIGILHKNIRNINYKKVLICFNYVAIANSILGILQFLTGKMLLPGVVDKSILYGSGANAVRRVGGLAATNNAAGNLGAILFSVVLFNYLREKDRQSLIAVILTSIFSVLTLTRIGYLAIAVEVFIYYVISKWNTVNEIRKKIKTIVIGSSAFIFAAVLFGQKVYETLFLKRGNTTKWRGIQFNRVFNLIIPKNSFVNGIGAGQYTDYAAIFLNYRDINIHSQYINILVENGALFLILFCILNVYLFIKAFMKTENILEKAFIISLFVGNIICCNYNPNQYYLINNYFYYILIYTYVYKVKNLSKEK